MRHIMLSSMELKIDDRISWLPIREADIVSGSYEQLILENADELLGKMDPQPRVLMIFVTSSTTCSGTDHEVFLGPLNEKYPDTRTIVCFMNPITGDGPRAARRYDTGYHLLPYRGCGAKGPRGKLYWQQPRHRAGQRADRLAWTKRDRIPAYQPVQDI